MISDLTELIMINHMKIENANFVICMLHEIHLPRIYHEMYTQEFKLHKKHLHYKADYLEANTDFTLLISFETSFIINYLLENFGSKVKHSYKYDGYGRYFFTLSVQKHRLHI